MNTIVENEKVLKNEIDRRINKVQIPAKDEQNEFQKNLELPLESKVLDNMLVDSAPLTDNELSILKKTPKLTILATNCQKKVFFFFDDDDFQSIYSSVQMPFGKKKKKAAEAAAAVASNSPGAPGPAKESDQFAHLRSTVCQQCFEAFIYVHVYICLQYIF